MILGNFIFEKKIWFNQQIKEQLQYYHRNHRMINYKMKI